VNFRARLITLLLPLTLISSCDSKKYEYRAFEALSVPEKLQQRQCPTPTSQRSLSGTNEMAFGPYTIKYIDNLLGIDASRSVKIGDPKINQYGELDKADDNRAWIEFGIYLPDAIPTFLNYTKMRKRIERGELYAVEIDLFWSQNESVSPESSFLIPRKSSFFSTPWVKASEDLMKKEDRSHGGTTYIYTPIGNNIPSTVKFIACSLNCTVISKVKKDLWLRYSYPSTNIKCWRYIDNEVHRTLDEIIFQPESESARQLP